VANHEAELDRIFAALGNETRRAMVARLVESPASVRDLAAPFAMSLPSVLQHLQVLQDCGLVTTRKSGRVRTCSIEPDGLRRAEAWLATQRTDWEQRLDALGSVLSEEN
jgi:DNA-binding transcriptional ArsR family regulator